MWGRVLLLVRVGPVPCSKTSDMLANSQYWKQTGRLTGQFPQSGAARGLGALGWLGYGIHIDAACRSIRARGRILY